MNRVDFNKIDRKKTFESKDIEPQKTGVTADDIELKNFFYYFLMFLHSK